jgi:hypothetical protein
MSPEIARNALILLARLELKGAEAPIFMQVMQAIQRFAEPSSMDTENVPRLSQEGKARQPSDFAKRMLNE